jgi:glycine/D-amino acid oxidase-like deaminating enzyme
MGLYTAYWLARSGNKIVLFEQYSVGHDNGRSVDSGEAQFNIISSHGDGRIVRSLNDIPVLTQLATRSLDHFRELEEISKTQLVHHCGCVVIAPKEALADWENTCKVSGQPHCLRF